MHMKDHKVSVIIPCYNYGRFLSRAVNSVLNQTVDNFEIIIVNDCSTDNTVEVINSFTDPRVKGISQTKNVGQAENRNSGIRNAKGMFIALLDADDWWHPKYLETILTAFDDPRVGAAYVFKQGWDENNEKIDIGYQKAMRGKITDDLFVSNFIGTPVIFRKCAIPNGYETNLSPQFNNLGVDWWILLDLSVSWRIIGFETPYYNYNFHGESISNNPERRILADKIIQQRFLEKHPGVVSKKAIKEAQFWSNLREGIYYRQAGRRATACVSFLKAISNKPFNIMPYKSLAYTVLKGG